MGGKSSSIETKRVRSNRNELKGEYGMWINSDRVREGGKRRVVRGQERLCRVRSKRKRMRRAFACIMKMRALEALNAVACAARG